MENFTKQYSITLDAKVFVSVDDLYQALKLFKLFQRMDSPELNGKNFEIIETLDNDRIFSETINGNLILVETYETKIQELEKRISELTNKLSEVERNKECKTENPNLISSDDNAKVSVTKDKINDRWANYDYSKNKMPEGVTVESTSVFKKDDGKYVVSAIINGERKTAGLYYNDVKAFFERGEDGAMTNRVTADMLVAKYFAKSYKAKENSADESTVKVN